MAAPKDSFQKLIDVVRSHADSSGHEMLSLSSELMQDYVEELDSDDKKALKEAKENILKWKDHVLDELTPEEEKEIDILLGVAKEDEVDFKDEVVANPQVDKMPVSDDWQDEKATIDFGRNRCSRNRL